MKFSEIEQWDELAPYLDTCLIPLTGLSGGEDPVVSADRLEDLRDLLELIEIPFKGRVVTYPAIHYITGKEDEHFQLYLDTVCQQLKEKANFKYVMILSLLDHHKDMKLRHADLLLTPDVPDGPGEPVTKLEADYRAKITGLWNPE